MYSLFNNSMAGQKKNLLEVLALFLSLVPFNAWAQESSDDTEELEDIEVVTEEATPITDCTSCHINPNMQPSYIGDNGYNHSLYVDKKQFEESIHYREGQDTCNKCHSQGYNVFPHNSPGKLTCLQCHEKDHAKFEEIAKEAAVSIHYQRAAERFDCSSCHSPHYIKRADESRLSEKNDYCKTCHNERNNPGGRSLLEIHSWHPLASLHLNNIACIACHTKPSNGVMPIAFKHRILGKEEASRKCKDCHSADGKMVNYLIDIGETPKTGLSQEYLTKQFYITGSTRIGWLDLLGLLMLASALLGGIGHGTLRYISRRKKT